MKLLHIRSPSYKPTNALSIVNVGREVMIINMPGLSTAQVMLVNLLLYRWLTSNIDLRKCCDSFCFRTIWTQPLQIGFMLRLL